MNIFGTEMTRQEVFDKGVAAILKQGEPSITYLGNCQYRGANGNKCLVGHLMPDEAYKPRFEGQRAAGVMRIRGTVEHNFINELQTCHDDAARQSGGTFVKRFRANALDFAKHYRLSTTVLDQ